MLQYRDIKSAFQDLGLQRSDTAIVYTSSRMIPRVKGGANTILGAILAGIDNIVMPSFTFKTMIIPEVGPPENQIDYGSGRIQNLNAHIYTPDLPADFEDREISELFRQYPDVTRSLHPIHSFLGLGLDAALAQQTCEDPYGHIEYLHGKGVRILLLDKDPSVIFSLHYCENKSERRQYTRWAMTAAGVKVCYSFPGCSRGFSKILYHMNGNFEQVHVEDMVFTSIPMDSLIDKGLQILRRDPFSLLCNDLHCERCNQIRQDIRQGIK